MSEQTGSKTVGSSSDVGNGWVERPLYGAGVEQMIGGDMGGMWWYYCPSMLYAVRALNLLMLRRAYCYFPQVD